MFNQPLYYYVFSGFVQLCDCLSQVCGLVISGNVSTLWEVDLGITSSSSSTSRVIPVNFNIGTVVSTLPGAWHGVSGRTGLPGVSRLWVGEKERLICNLHFSMPSRKISQICSWDRLACCWGVEQPRNNSTAVGIWEICSDHRSVSLNSDEE